MSLPSEISLDLHVKKVGVLIQGFQDRLVNNRYRVQEIIGHGAVGVVFKARDEKLARDVALKVFRADFDSSKDKDIAYNNYLKESRIAASLSHPNIISIFDIGVMEDMPDKNPFIAMAYVDGSSLEAMIEKKSLTVTETVRIFYHLAGALDYAHSRKPGILHRDIKPKNILVASDGKPVLIDFGLSRYADGVTTSVGLFKGSAAYMAPDLLDAYCHYNVNKLTRALQPPSDLYSLGATFYRALVGENPYPGLTYNDIVEAVSTTTPLPPSKLNSNVPAALDDIVLKLLEKTAARRTKSAPDLRKSLRQLLLSMEPADLEMDDNDSGKNDKLDADNSDDILMDEKFNGVVELQPFRQKPKVDINPAVKPMVAAGGHEKNKQFAEVMQGLGTPPSKNMLPRPVLWLVGGIVVAVIVGGSIRSLKNKVNSNGVTTERQAETHVPPVLRQPPLPGNPQADWQQSDVAQTMRDQAGSSAPTGPSPTAKASKVSYRSTGNELVVFSRKVEKVKELVHGVPSGTEIKEVYLMNKVVSFNIATPVKAGLRLDFKLEGQDEVILPRESIFVGEARVGKSNDRVLIDFFQVITPDHKTIQINASALMEDGSLGLVGSVNWPKGKSPILQASTDVLSTAGRVAIGALDADSYGERIGKSIGAASVNNTDKLLTEDYQKLPEITVEAYTPLKVYLREGF